MRQEERTNETSPQGLPAVRADALDLGETIAENQHLTRDFLRMPDNPRTTVAKLVVL